MGVIRRRHIRLVQAEMQGINIEERQWLRAQGVDRPEELPRRSLWYHPMEARRWGRLTPITCACTARRGSPSSRRPSRPP